METWGEKDKTIFEPSYTSVQKSDRLFSYRKLKKKQLNYQLMFRLMLLRSWLWRQGT